MLSVLLILTAVAKVPTTLKPPREAGAALYQDNCWQCHGEHALGDGPLSPQIPSPPLAGRVERQDFDALVDIILHGAGPMPAYDPVLSTHNSRSILLWLEGLDPVTGLDPKAAGEPPEDEEEPPDEPAEPAQEPEAAGDDEEAAAPPE